MLTQLWISIRPLCSLVSPLIVVKHYLLFHKRSCRMCFPRNSWLSLAQYYFSFLVIYDSIQDSTWYYLCAYSGSDLCELCHVSIGIHQFCASSPGEPHHLQVRTEPPLSVTWSNALPDRSYSLQGHLTWSFYLIMPVIGNHFVVNQRRWGLSIASRCNFAVRKSFSLVKMGF